MRAMGYRVRGLSEIHMDSADYKQICDTFYEKVGKEMQKVAEYIKV